MKKFIYSVAFALSTAGLGMVSCVDYDEPGDEFNPTDVILNDSVYHGRPDSIDFKREFTEEEVDSAIANLETQFRQTLTGQYAMRGGKNGDIPGSHAYQRQFSLGPDNYAQYSTVPHYDFMYGTLQSTYDISQEFNGGPNGSFLIVKNALVPIINHPLIDLLPEMKAIYLLLYCYSSQEIADIYGPFPFHNFMQNYENPPFVYNSVEDIYTSTVKNVDLVVECLRNFESRPDWYKAKVQELLYRYCVVTQDLFNGTEGVESFVRLANSLKLRIAMHIVKVNPTLAQQWAEEAVASGVIDDVKYEAALCPMSIGFTHPLPVIWTTWGDARLSASFESLLISLKHPFADYLFEKNSGELTNTKTGDVLATGTRIVGLREGIHPGQGQSYSSNYMIGFSTISTDAIAMAPLYIMKISEVDFLRAEGAVRGWNMGGDADFFYNRGIQYGYVNDRLLGDEEYNNRLSDYMNLTEPVDYTYHDPLGIVEDMPSVTKIGVKWNDGDSQETKLEKIITQKYIANFPYSFESWTDMRRTGYPKVFPVLHADEGDGTLRYGDIIRRCVFPNTDDASLIDIDRTGLDALGGEDYQSTRLWWDVDKPNF